MSEQRLQSEVVKYLKYKYPSVRFCASGGGMRTFVTVAKRMKDAGYVKGFPDLQITEARGSFFGLFIELKTEKGRPTKEQKEWIKDLQDRGYKAIICKGIDETLKTIDDYLKMNDTIGVIAKLGGVH
tara:strand:+ start:1947 stop:2327 length:381 start_codon:yes stop_codon:yes gene_type:complete